jgi:hypothetical protein
VKEFHHSIQGITTVNIVILEPVSSVFVKYFVEIHAQVILIFPNEERRNEGTKLLRQNKFCEELLKKIKKDVFVRYEKVDLTSKYH